MQLKPITAIAVILLVITSLLIAGCTSNTQTNTQSGSGSDKTTFSSDRGYSITYPTAWEKDVSTNAASPVELYLYASPTEKVDGVLVATKSLTSVQTLSDFVNVNVKELQNYSNTGF